MNIKEHAQKAIQAVIAQGAKSKRPNGNGCMYRSPVGCCAVGHLIADEHYHKGLEGMGASAYDIVDAVEFSTGLELNGRDMDLLNALQRAHDSTPTEGFVDGFRVKAARVMRDYEDKL